MAATPNRNYSEIPGGAVPDVPYRVNLALREVDADVQILATATASATSIAATAAGASTTASAAATQATKDVTRLEAALEEIDGENLAGTVAAAEAAAALATTKASEAADSAAAALAPTDAAVTEVLTAPESEAGTLLRATYARKIAFDIRDYGASEAALDNTAALREAAEEAGLAKGLLVIPSGLWISDPVPLNSYTTVHAYGDLRLRGQDAAGLPAAHGVLYAYGTSEARKTNIKILGFGGRIDGNRRGMTGAMTYDQEGINFKYVDNSEISGIELFDCIESGIDLDNSSNCIVRGNYSHDNYGNGFHLSNGALDNLIDGNTAKNNGFGNDRNGFDQYAGSSPEANRNRYVNNRAIGNNRNYKIEGQKAIFDDSNTSENSVKPNIITANLKTLSPLAPAVRVPSGLPVIPEPIGGSTVDAEVRTAVNSILDLLASVGLRNAPVLIGSDTFTRADGTLGIADTEQPWIGYPSLFRVIGNQAGLAPGVTAVGSTYWATGSADVRITTTQTLAPIRSRAGVSFRQTIDDKILVLEFAKTGSASQLALRKRENGVSTDLYIVPSFTPVLGRTYAVRVEAVGDRITAWVDGVQVVDYTLNSTDAATYGGRDRHGLYGNASSTSDDGGTRWDDFKVYKMPTA